MYFCFLPRVLAGSRITRTVSAESLDRKQNHTDSLCRKPFFVDGSLGRKQEITDSSAEAKYDGQSLQEAESHGQSLQEAIFRGR